MSSALIDAQERGVEVIGIFDNSQAGSSYSEDDVLAEAGVPVYLDGNEHNSGYAGGKLHHKLMITDPFRGGAIVTGSMNWSNAGNEDNDENLLRLEGTGHDALFLREFCAAMDIATLHEDYTGSEPASPCARD